ncbi:hypothetical protein BD410DRAFT_796443 [Rickenella mellea]|uniref:Uncharacterized protein n=1 Tax=Rickenella mellea TaxID=50990 RepID=A0A4Y7PIU5_9AGAM|nr:hypothetical protein BD410DRAFT_796443 [Rickenella mellea]
MQPSRRQSAALIPSSHLCKYVVQSSDVIDDMRIQVSEEGTEKIHWYKERFLTDDEIVENIVENETSTICWTIHRPKRGWYIRLRAPSFPPGIFIPVTPVPSSDPFHAEAALSLSCRTSCPPPIPTARKQTISPTARTSEETTRPEPEGATVHSYPPTPPTASTVKPPSPAAIQAKLDQVVRPAERTASKNEASQITKFILTPHSAPRVPQMESASFVTRALTFFKNSAPSHSSSFVLCPLPSSSTPERAASRTASSHPRQLSRSIAELVPPSPPALLTFHDRTPLWTVYSNHGLIEIDLALEREMGVDRSFWIAVALTYLEFLGDRESYIAAADG